MGGIVGIGDFVLIAGQGPIDLNHIALGIVGIGHHAAILTTYHHFGLGWVAVEFQEAGFVDPAADGVRPQGCSILR